MTQLHRKINVLLVLPLVFLRPVKQYSAISIFLMLKAHCVHEPLPSQHSPCPRSWADLRTSTLALVGLYTLYLQLTYSFRLQAQILELLKYCVEHSECPQREFSSEPWCKFLLPRLVQGPCPSESVSDCVLDRAQGQIKPFDMEYKHVLSVHVSNTCTSSFSHATDAHIPLELFDSAEESL